MQQQTLQGATGQEMATIQAIYHFCRLQWPQLPLPASYFAQRLQACWQRWQQQHPQASYKDYLSGLHARDLFLASACLYRLEAAWEFLFASRANLTESLLVDALRSWAARLFPRDRERQEEAVQDFWGHLLAGEREGSVPILGRYDGKRPLVPWLIRVFRNKIVTQLKQTTDEIALPDEDIGAVDTYQPEQAATHWHEHFRAAARDWLAELSDSEILLLGLRVRYQLSQREVAKHLGIHEGNVTRRLDAINRKCHERIGQALRELGWTGDDLFDFIRTEMGTVLLEEPRLAADRLAALLAATSKART